MQTVTITLKLKTRSPNTAAAIAQGAAEHLMETFNDDGSIRGVYWVANAPKTPDDLQHSKGA